MADAAQEFLNKQLSKNRFTAGQQSRLDDNGGASVVGASDGIVPAGAAYAKYGKMPGTDSTSPKGSDSSSGTSTSTSTGYSGPDKRDEMFGADTDWGRNYRAGIYGGGDYDKDALAAKFGLDNSKEAEAKGGEENIYGTRADGSSVFLGRMSMDLASNSELIKAHSKQRHQDEGDHQAEGGNLDSMGDITGALLASWKDSGPQKAATEPEKERTPIEHSPEVKQAAARVRAYEDNIMSGKTSSDIFGDTYGKTGLELKSSSDSGTTDNNKPNVMDRINEKYSIDLNDGGSGIGTTAAPESTSTDAADSFLSSKKTGYKQAYNFKPNSNLSYGAN